jgi:hypothetical protein
VRLRGRAYVLLTHGLHGRPQAGAPARVTHTPSDAHERATPDLDDRMTRRPTRLWSATATPAGLY